MTFDEAYSTNPEQIRRDRYRALVKARVQQTRCDTSIVRSCHVPKDSYAYNAHLAAATRAAISRDHWVQLARRLNWRLIFCKKQRSLLP
jgi:hypothetical protein